MGHSERILIIKTGRSAENMLIPSRNQHQVSKQKEWLLQTTSTENCSQDMKCSEPCSQKSQQSGKMIQALPSALYDFAVNCDNMGQMQSVVARIANRHVQQGVQGWHYPMLAQCFIEAFSQGLGSDATPAVIEAWTEGIKLFANEIMKIENLKRDSMASI